MTDGKSVFEELEAVVNGDRLQAVGRRIQIVGYEL